MFTGGGMMIIAVLTTAAGLIACSFVTGFFLAAAFGPILTETCYIITGARLYTFGYGYVSIACGTGWLLGAPAAGECHLQKIYHPLCPNLYIWLVSSNKHTPIVLHH